MIFRGLLTVLVVGDIQTNWVPRLEFIPSFAFGAHIMNNWIAYGFQRGLDTMLQGVSGFQYTISLVILIFLASVVLTGTYTITNATFKLIRD